MTIRELASEIAARLFVNGAGEHAERLVLELPDKRNGGGWCETAVINLIEDSLRQADKKKTNG